MWKKIATGVTAAALMLGPSTVMLGMAVLMNPSTNCLPASALTVGQIPGSLTATSSDGTVITLNTTQLTHAATIITVGGQTTGVGSQGVTIALMAALAESGLRMLANTDAYPGSVNYPNDGNGSDHDSLGLFQMRPRSGWGSVPELMDPTYQAKAFFGGPDGPKYPSPRGLLDIPGWQQLNDGEAAQAVEVSAYPDRYANYQPVAEAIITALARPRTSNGSSRPSSETSAVAETRRVVFPLPAGTWVMSAAFGWRTDPISGRPEFHQGTDYAAPAGTPILAATDGFVLHAGMNAGTGTITILSTVNAQPVSFTYLHMYQDGIDVRAGQVVTAGQQIGQVGSTGHSTGPHLHFEVHPGGPTAPPVDPAPWLATHDAIPTDAPNSAGCAASF